jgi:hypothetical protein
MQHRALDCNTPTTLRRSTSRQSAPECSSNREIFDTQFHEEQHQKKAHFLQTSVIPQ